MSNNNPSITVSDITTDVENRLLSPGISGSVYIPWVSYAYQKTYQALLGVNQRVKEELFGNLISVTLTPGTAEYSVSTNIPRFGGIIKVEIRYGASGDDWERAERLDSVAHWKIQNNVSTNYRSKTSPLYYIIEDIIGFIPTPPSGESTQTPTARVWYIQRPYQITLTTDVIDIPYRFTYPIVNYVQARAIERENEDYDVALSIERKFEQELENIATAASSEYSEEEQTNFVRVGSDSGLYEDPLSF